MSLDSYVSLAHLKRISDELDKLSASVIDTAISEISYKREVTNEMRELLNKLGKSGKLSSKKKLKIANLLLR